MLREIEAQKRTTSIYMPDRVHLDVVFQRTFLLSPFVLPSPFLISRTELLLFLPILPPSPPFPFPPFPPSLSLALNYTLGPSYAPAQVIQQFDRIGAFSPSPSPFPFLYPNFGLTHQLQICARSIQTRENSRFLHFCANLW